MAAKPAGARALVDAVYGGDAKAFQTLLDAGVAADARDRGTTALQAAASQGHARIVQMLLGAGADPDARDRDGLSLLVQAIRSENAPVVRALLAAGADVNRAETHGGSRETSLMTAAMQGSLRLVQLLAGAGASVQIRSGKGDTALDLARRCGEQMVVEFLESLQAKTGDGSDTATPQRPRSRPRKEK